MADSLDCNFEPRRYTVPASDRLGRLTAELNEYDKSYIIRLLSQQIDRSVELQNQNKQLSLELDEQHKKAYELEKSYLRRVDSLDQAKDRNQRHIATIDTLEHQMMTFRDLCHKTDEKLSIVESTWHNKYVQLSAYTDEYIKQTAALAEQYSRNLGLLKADKLQLEGYYESAQAELLQARSNNSILTQELSKGLGYVEQLHSALKKENTHRQRLQLEIAELQFLKAKYEQTCQLSKEIIEKYQALQQKCIALEMDKAKVAEFGRQYKRKLQELEISVQEELQTKRSSEGLETNRLRDELKAKDLKHLKELRIQQRLVEDARKLNDSLQERISDLQRENIELRSSEACLNELLSKEQSKCQTICSRIQEFWGRDSSLSSRALRPVHVNQESSQSIHEAASKIKPCLKSGNSRKTLHTSASVGWKEDGHSDFTDSNRL